MNDTATDTKIIDGKAFAAGLRTKVAAQVEALKSRHGIEPGLAVVLAGEHPASQVYVRNKARQTREAGMQSFEHRLPAATAQDDLLALVRQLNRDPRVSGILVQLPLPEQISADAVIATIDPAKDADGFHYHQRRPARGRWRRHGPVHPARLSDAAERSARGSRRRPRTRARALEHRGQADGPVAHPGELHGDRRPLPHPRSCRGVPARGHPRRGGRPAPDGPRRLDPAGAPRSSTSASTGSTRGTEKTKLAGDVDFESALPVAGGITPVPGGVGPMTIACLLHNTVLAACRRHGVEVPEG